MPGRIRQGLWKVSHSEDALTEVDTVMGPTAQRRGPGAPSSGVELVLILLTHSRH